MTTHITIFICCIVGFSQSTLSDTIHVPADYSAIQTAIDSAAVGDTVLVDPGVYVENIDFHGKQLVVASQFLSTGDTSMISQTVIDGNRDSSVVSFENSEPLGTELVGFSIRNGLGTGDWPNVRGGGIHAVGAANPTIRYCYIYDNESTGSSNRGGGIYVRNAVISNCKIYRNTASQGAGIMFGNGTNDAIVDSCNIYSNIGFGAFGCNYSRNVTLRRSIIHNNDGWGIRFFSTDDAEIIHCTITGNNGAGIKNSSANDLDTLFIVNTISFANADSFDFVNDTLVQASYSIIEKGSGKIFFGTGCKDADPLFANANYELSANSPAIDAGDPNYQYDPDNTVADMGAHFYLQPTGIEDETHPGLTEFRLAQNYPNPFNPSTMIKYSLPKAGFVELTLFDITGQRVQTIVSAHQSAGFYSVQLNANHLASGFYFYRLNTENFSATKKMLLLR